MQHLHHVVDEVVLDAVAVAEDDESAVGDVLDLVPGEGDVRPAREHSARGAVDESGVAHERPSDDDPPAGDERRARAAGADRAAVDQDVAAAADVEPHAGGVPYPHAVELEAVHLADDHRRRRGNAAEAGAGAVRRRRTGKHDSIDPNVASAVHHQDMAQRRADEVEPVRLLAGQRLVVDPTGAAVEEPAARRHALADVEDLVLELALRTHRPVGGLLHLDDLRRAVDALDGAERVGPHVQEMDVGAREVHRVGYVLRVVGHDAVFVVRRRARPVPRQVGQEKRAEARGMLEAVGAAGDDRRLYPIAVLRERAEESRLAVSPLRVGGPERRPLDPAPARHLDAAAELDLAGALGAKDEPRHGGDLERTLQKVAPRLDCNFMRRRLVSRGGRERGGEFLGRADGHRTGRSRRCRRQRRDIRHVSAGEAVVCYALRDIADLTPHLGIEVRRERRIHHLVETGARNEKAPEARLPRNRLEVVRRLLYHAALPHHRHDRLHRLRTGGASRQHNASQYNGTLHQSLYLRHRTKMTSPPVLL